MIMNNVANIDSIKIKTSSTKNWFFTGGILQECVS